MSKHGQNSLSIALLAISLGTGQAVFAQGDPVIVVPSPAPVAPIPVVTPTTVDTPKTITPQVTPQANINLPAGSQSFGTIIPLDVNRQTDQPHLPIPQGSGISLQSKTQPQIENKSLMATAPDQALLDKIDSQLQELIVKFKQAQTPQERQKILQAFIEVLKYAVQAGAPGMATDAKTLAVLNLLLQSGLDSPELQSQLMTWLQQEAKTQIALGLNPTKEQAAALKDQMALLDKVADKLIALGTKSTTTNVATTEPPKVVTQVVQQIATAIGGAINTPTNVTANSNGTPITTAMTDTVVTNIATAVQQGTNQVITHNPAPVVNVTIKPAPTASQIPGTTLQPIQQLQQIQDKSQIAYNTLSNILQTQHNAIQSFVQKMGDASQQNQTAQNAQQQEQLQQLQQQQQKLKELQSKLTPEQQQQLQENQDKINNMLSTITEAMNDRNRTLQNIPLEGRTVPSTPTNSTPAPKPPTSPTPTTVTNTVTNAVGTVKAAPGVVGAIGSLLSSAFGGSSSAKASTPIASTIPVATKVSTPTASLKASSGVSTPGATSGSTKITSTSTPAATSNPSPKAIDTVISKIEGQITDLQKDQQTMLSKSLNTISSVYDKVEQSRTTTSAPVTPAATTPPPVTVTTVKDAASALSTISQNLSKAETKYNSLTAQINAAQGNPLKMVQAQQLKIEQHNLAAEIANLRVTKTNAEQSFVSSYGALAGPGAAAQLSQIITGKNLNQQQLFQYAGINP